MIAELNRIGRGCQKLSFAFFADIPHDLSAMKSKKYRSKTGRPLKVLLLLVLVYLGGTVGYYFLPWSVRKSVYKLSPTIDSTLRGKGFDTAQAWDDLGLWGRDCRTAVDSLQRGDHV